MTTCRSDLPPLEIRVRPDGTPDWPAVNALAREIILNVLRSEGTMSGAHLEHECQARGVHPKVTFYSRRELERAGLIQGADGWSGGRRARLWSLPLGGAT